VSGYDLRTAAISLAIYGAAYTLAGDWGIIAVIALLAGLSKSGLR
jgi:uncharacterized membrane protein